MSEGVTDKELKTVLDMILQYARGKLTNKNITMADVLGMLEEIRHRAYLAGVADGLKAPNKISKNASSSFNYQEDYEFKVSGSEAFVEKCMGAYIAIVEKWRKEGYAGL